MNIKNRGSLFLLLILLSATISCTKDYLEQEPDNRIKLNSLEKAAEALVYAYPENSYVFTEWMTDNVTYIPTLSDVNWIRDIYTWKENISSTEQDTPTGYWNSAYYAIAQTNAVLSAIDNIKTDNTAYKNAIKGEALLCRAYAHFMLVNLFAKNYDPKTASADPGIPYVTQLEKQLIVDYKRNTVIQVYDLVEKDLLEGMKLVSKKYYKNSGKFHFNKQSALAFASRFYLWKKDYKNAEKYATQLLSEGESEFVRNYQKDVLTPQSFKDIGINFTNPNVFSNLMIGKQNVRYSGTWGGLSPVAYSSTLSLFKNIFSLNKRISPYQDKRYVAYSGNSSSYTDPKSREAFETTNPITNVGFRYDTEVLFRGEEVILNRAEARLMQDEIAGAMSDLNYIIDDRYKQPPGVVLEFLEKSYMKGSKSKKEALLKLIIDQRQVEFFTEGLRWFDIKRFDLSVTHTKNENTVILTPNDSRKVLQIPNSAIKFGIKPSPRPQKNVSLELQQFTQYKNPLKKNP